MVDHRGNTAVAGIGAKWKCGRAVPGFRMCCASSADAAPRADLHSHSASAIRT
jgi:hypothetical protein